MPVPELDAFLAGCRDVIRARHVVTDPEVVARYTTDWTGRWVGAAPAVLRPGSSGEVAGIVGLAARHRVALVPQGGNTGLVGGATPVHGEVVVSLERLAQLGPVDAAAAQVTAGAGVTLEALAAHAAPSGMSFAVDLAARASATVGGMVATNAGGVHVLRHGAMRAQVLGLTAVLGTGETVVVNPGGLLKDNTGYDLVGLLCGSEGTLGIVTEARLRLVPTPSSRVVALVGLADVESAVAALGPLRALPELHAVEVMTGDGLRRVGDHLGRDAPLDPLPGWVLLVEVAGEEGLADRLGGVLAALPGVTASAVAVDGPAQRQLWRWRDAHSEAAAGLGLVHKADVTVPVVGMARFLTSVRSVVDAACPGAPTLLFGHLGDGNVHVNVIGSDGGPERALDRVFELVLELGGSVSAEHGIGAAKRAWLLRQRGPVAVGAMRAIKHALDPAGILNPNVLLP